MSEHTGQHAATHEHHKSLEGMETPLTQPHEVEFFFKTVEDKDTKEKTKRPNVKLTIPVLTIEGLVAGLTDADDKIKFFILDTINEEIVRAARIQVDSDVKPVNKTEELDLSLLTLKFLANQPASERRGGGIAKEVWEAFATDYATVIQSAAGKTKEQAENAAAILAKKLQPAKSKKPVLQYLKTQLALYVAHTKELEEFKSCVEFLDNKIDAFLSIDDEALLANL